MHQGVAHQDTIARHDIAFAPVLDVFLVECPRQAEVAQLEDSTIVDE